MIAICPNPFRDIDLEITHKVAALLNDQGCQTAICPVFSEEGDSVLPSGLSYSQIETVCEMCSLAVVIGGDGTILETARRINDHELPLLGINLGTMGFMAHLEKEQLPLILNAAAGRFRRSKRMKLDVELIREGRTMYTDCVLNDAVIHGYGDCINMTVACAGDVISSFSGDGLVLSTPTGSTGYSMSAGGPIVEPEAENIIISSICPHSMTNRSFVLAPDKVIEVRTERLRGRRAYLSADGNCVFDLENGDTLRVKRSEHYTVMADLGIRSFFDIAYNKLK